MNSVLNLVQEGKNRLYWDWGKGSREQRSKEMKKGTRRKKVRRRCWEKAARASGVSYSVLRPPGSRGGEEKQAGHRRKNVLVASNISELTTEIFLKDRLLAT